MATTDTQLEQIIFNTMSQEKYDELKANGQINPNEIYLVQDNGEMPENAVEADNYVNAKLWKGTLAEYEALGTYDDSTTYIITDDATELDVYTKEEIDNKLENLDVDLSDYATKEDLEASVSVKADQETTYTKWETENLVYSNIPQIVGGNYIEVTDASMRTLYEYQQPDLLTQQTGMQISPTMYLEINQFEYEAPMIFSDFEEVETPVSDIYKYKIKEEHVQYLNVVLKSDGSVYTVFDSFTDDFYTMFGLTDLSYESKVQFLETNLGGHVDINSIVYAMKFQGFDANNEPMEQLMGVYRDNYDNYIVPGVLMWNPEPSNTIEMSMGNIKRIDWNWNAHDTINNLNLRIDEVNNNHIIDNNNLSNRIEEVNTKHVEDFNNLNFRIDEVNNNHVTEVAALNTRIDDVSNMYGNDIININSRIDEVNNNYITDFNNLNNFINENNNEIYNQLNQKANQVDTYTKWEVDNAIANSTPNIQGGGYIDVVTHNQAEIYGYEKSSNVPAEPDLGWMPYYTTIIPLEYITLTEYLSTPTELYSLKVGEEDVNKLVTVHHADHSNVMFRDIIENSNIYSLAAPMLGYDAENLTDEQKNEIIDIMFPNVNKDEMVWAGYCYAVENTALTSDFIGVFAKDMDGNYGLITHLMGNVTPVETILAPIPSYTTIDLNQWTIETLDNKAFRHEIPTMTSQLVNDSGFITEYQDVSGKADITYVDERISNVYTDINTTNENIINDLTAEINKKANIEDVYTKTEVDAKISSIYTFKGTVATFDDLPTEGLVIGDVYNVADTGANYAWADFGWDSLGTSVDLTPYMTTEDANNTFVTQVNAQAVYETIENANNTRTNLEASIASKISSEEAYNNFLTLPTLEAHTSNMTNPHNVTKEQVGLGNVENTADMDKPVSTATWEVLNAKADDSLVVHINGIETIQGTKTFATSPLIPTIEDITDSTQSAASTKFVQDVVNTVKTTITYWD